jgi:SOS-response transcriptional repressor LexA
MAETLRPTKKQRQLLTFIEGFIKEHGYSPSYREIMNGLGYNSVATVALHVNNLITRGHLRKRDHSARSLEVVGSDAMRVGSLNAISETQEKWLIERVDGMLKQIEGSTSPIEKDVDDIYVLIGALHVLGMDDAVRAFVPRLTEAKKKSNANPVA